MHKLLLRNRLVVWLYLITFGHFAAGILLAWFSHLAIFDNYHLTILNQVGDTSVGARQLNSWWLSLFGATLQNLAILMGVLIFAANRHRKAYIWLWMIIGLLVWAPQDMLISMQLNLRLHLWADAIALLLLLPPLVILYRVDSKASRASSNN